MVAASASFVLLVPIEPKRRGRGRGCEASRGRRCSTERQVKTTPNCRWWSSLKVRWLLIRAFIGRVGEASRRRPPAIRDSLAHSRRSAARGPITTRLGQQHEQKSGKDPQAPPSARYRRVRTSTSNPTSGSLAAKEIGPRSRIKPKRQSRSRRRLRTRRALPPHRSAEGPETSEMRRNCPGEHSTSVNRAYDGLVVRPVVRTTANGASQSRIPCSPAERWFPSHAGASSPPRGSQTRACGLRRPGLPEQSARHRRCFGRV